MKGELDVRFPKTFRLRKKREFDCVFASGVSVSDRNVKLVVLANALSHSRLGLVVGKRHGAAVKRNRLRRRIREAFRRNRATLPCGLDIVAIPMRADLTYAAIVDSLRALVTKAKKRIQGPATRAGEPGAERLP